jgi:hypothetical protein
MSAVPPAAKSLAGGERCLLRFAKNSSRPATDLLPYSLPPSFPSGLINTAFQIGSGCGLAVCAAIVTSVTTKAGGDLESIPVLLKGYQVRAPLPPSPSPSDLCHFFFIRRLLSTPLSASVDWAQRSPYSVSTAPCSKFQGPFTKRDQRCLPCILSLSFFLPLVTSSLQ